MLWCLPCEGSLGHPGRLGLDAVRRIRVGLDLELRPAVLQLRVDEGCPRHHRVAEVSEAFHSLEFESNESMSTELHTSPLTVPSDTVTCRLQ